MRLPARVRFSSLLIALFSFSWHAHAMEPLKFGVLNQMPVVLTAQLWHPILQHLSNTSGTQLEFVCAPDTHYKNYRQFYRLAHK